MAQTFLHYEKIFHLAWLLQGMWDTFSHNSHVSVYKFKRRGDELTILFLCTCSGWDVSDMTLTGGGSVANVCHICFTCILICAVNHTWCFEIWTYPIMEPSDKTSNALCVGIRQTRTLTFIQLFFYFGSPLFCSKQQRSHLMLDN